MVVHTTLVGGRQWPMRHTRPGVQVASDAHVARQVPSMQSLPPAQSPALLHWPVGRTWHRPAWHDEPVAQSVSTLHPNKHFEFTHHAP